MEFTLSRCRGADIAEKIDAVEVLIGAGVPVSDKAKQEVKRIGEGIEFHRRSFPEDRAVVIDNAIQRLYQLTGVEPVARRRLHDGVSPITVTTETWQKQYQELWDYLVPSIGACQTVQGEVIRISGRIADELIGTGGANWDADYRLMSDCLLKLLAMDEPLEKDSLAETEGIISRAKECAVSEEELQRLQELCVGWVRKNPEPISMKRPPYRR